ncbi:hypothetical protein [Streptomyces phaeochromogenes]|uniref:hypothetical protein n=1 Tax=Streptomyces phaeochromogenes TaxID=1923 RepID=UPI00225A96E5|nr:hypothetical protein [Streptomyces phaeochromogenes]
MRELGRPGKVDASQARQRLISLHVTTGWNDLAAAIDGSAANLRDIAHGRRLTIRRTTHNKIMQLKAAPSGGQYIDGAGSRRRIQALRAIGWSAKAIAQQAASSQARIQLISNGQATVRYSLTVKIRNAYTALSQTPAPAGYSASRVKGHAIRNGWAPPAAWDDDTIDDPQAHPDWTGHCGTDRGYWMHSLQRLPMCERCRQAHEVWLDEQAHLTVQELNQARFRARANASHREADLAHDARELLRVSGLDVQLAAERLGVTRNHLQQALLRNPEPAVEQDEAVAA